MATKRGNVPILWLVRQIRWFPYIARSDVERLQQIYQCRYTTEESRTTLVVDTVNAHIVYDFVKFFKSELFSQTWTDVSKNSSNTAKNTENGFSRNISGKTCSQEICVWATLIQDNSAAVWWTAHARNRCFCWK
jgi:hypothetical protein